VSPAGALRTDAEWMDRALVLAAAGLGLTSPNPLVGAVLVKDGAVVGEGTHRRAGLPHAEALALAAAGSAAAGGTMYVTLEPCAHHGRTPPCADALVAADLARVVVACEDPNPIVDGRGLARLRAAGIRVDVGLRAAEARALNRAFFCRMTRGRPHVTLKSALTLDGKIAAVDGASRWITGEAARHEAHRMRFAADAILVGIGTVLADDPELTVRHPELSGKEPLRVVADSRLRIPPGARVLAAGDPSRTVVACVAPAPSDLAATLRRLGTSILELPGDAGRVDLRALLDALAARDVVAVLAEGGAELAAGLLDAGLVDRLAFFLAPRLLGGRGAPGPVGGVGRALKDAVGLVDVTSRQVGEDLLVEADVVI
jgi:diaminohydroxyphosphoribosylaminopyrimidine deaminase / 5-amino-6-(5-phosphoribosylamino)uracil reductase